MKSFKISWADLTPDGIFSISEFIDTHSDRLRFRAVCNSWRTTIPSPQEQVLLPKKMYFPSNNAKDQLNLGYVLFQSTVYRIEDPEGSPNDGWLIMVSEPNEQGKFCLLNPFTMQKDRRNEAANPAQPLNNLTIGEDYWSLVNREIEYRDIAGHNGYVYVVDRFGIVVAVQESSYNCITIPVPYPFLGDWFLVKSGGDLLLVGRDYALCDDQVYYHNPTDSFIRRPAASGHSPLMLPDFDEIEGNHIIFVDEVKYPIDSDDEEDFDDEQEEPVDEFWGLLLEDIKVRVYDVEETFDIPLEYQPEYHKIFWPPPEWLRQYRSPSSHQTDQ
ncbi:hypothetical protein Patl1_04014 [Pistacia atlantica]|uniref:Uncharacterized protein n=1 Tax=Pistacia atlantica TaxID=434234 RepID=A0ACC1BWC8_9ROSI|nr:hypothetical protein Patl1_04014 [Pistacia atlantica]